MNDKSPFVSVQAPSPYRMLIALLFALDDASQMDLFYRDSDDDQIEEQLDETEARWRKERIEREQWLRDQVGCLHESHPFSL